MKHSKLSGTPNQKQLAKYLGVSQMTISRVLNNRVGVGAGLKRKIQAKIQALGYIHNRQAAGLRGRCSNVIGLVIPDVSNSFFPAITASIERCASAHGYRVILAHSHESYQQEASKIALWREFRVDGFIIAPAGTQNQIGTYLKLRADGLPFVFIDRLKQGLSCDYVVSDTKTGAFELGRYLISKGYRHWGYIRGPRGISSSQEHEQGLRRSIAKMGQARLTVTVVSGGFDESDGYRGAAKFPAGARPDVIVAINDSVATGAYRYLQEQGIAVPSDVALAGFSNLAWTHLLEVPLTTVSEPTDEIGCRAFDLLLRRIAAPGADYITTRLPVHLLIRAST